MLETGTFGAARRVQRPVGYVLGGLGVGGLFGCTPLIENPGPDTPDPRIVVDCEKDPAARSTQDVLVAGIQIVRLVVTGSGYSQESRVQLLGIRSDINVSGPDGQGPKQHIWPGDLETGKPVVVPLQGGGFFTVQQRAQGVNPGHTSTPAPSAAAAENWLTFTLSCLPPAEAPASLSPD